MKVVRNAQGNRTVSDLKAGQTFKVGGDSDENVFLFMTTGDAVLLKTGMLFINIHSKSNERFAGKTIEIVEGTFVYERAKSE